MKLKGPYTILLEVRVTDGERTGKVTIDLPFGCPPTEEEINACVKQAEDTVKEQGFRLMTKTEFFNTVFQERTGATEKFAVPGGNEWDK
jgi:coenzyme F420-reducing hydrogenase gamma subunit